jgi:microcystin-dependent protein
MPTSPTPRLGLVAPVGGDPADVPSVVRAVTDRLEEVAVGYAQGRLDNRPGAGQPGRLYYDTDGATLHYDTGTTWVPFAWQPGDIRWTAAFAAPPAGWLELRGQVLRQLDYPALFNRIGHYYNDGVPPLTGSFKLPDLQGRTVVAPDPGAAAGRLTSFNGLGQASGADRHTLTEAEMPSHRHDIDPLGRAAAGVDGNYSIGISNPTGGRYNTRFSGGNGPHNNMPPYQVLNAWIKT